MKLSDISDLSKEDILSALGLASKPSNSERLLSAVGIFGVGLLVGAGAALLFAPKSGQGLREDLSERFRKVRNGDGEAAETSDAPHAQGEART